MGIASILIVASTVQLIIVHWFADVRRPAIVFFFSPQILELSPLAVEDRVCLALPELLQLSTAAPFGL